MDTRTIDPTTTDVAPTLTVFVATQVHASPTVGEVGLSCLLWQTGPNDWVGHVTATSGVGYELAPDDAATLARILRPAQEAYRPFADFLRTVGHSD